MRGNTMMLQEEHLYGYSSYGYQFSALLNKNALGSTYVAAELSTEKTVAVQVFPPAIRKDPVLAEAIHVHLANLENLDHANLIKTQTLIDGKDGFILVHDYVEGIGLDAYLKEKGAIDWELAVRFLKQILSGLSYAHDAGIIHRHLRPENIIISRGTAAKILNLGLAQVIQENSFMAAGDSHAEENRPYAAPESSSHFGQVTEATDIYALGIVAYEMLTGADVNNLSKTNGVRQEITANLNRNTRVPQKLTAIVTKAIEEHAVHRFQRAPAMLNALESLQSSDTKLKVVYHKKPLKKRWLARIPLLLLLAGCLSVIASAGYIFLQSQNANPFVALDQGAGGQPASMPATTAPNGTADSPQTAAPTPNIPPPLDQPPISRNLESPPSLPTQNAVSAAPARPTHHTLIVRSNPPGASVAVDGIEMGTTPFQLNNITGRKSTVQLTINGFEPLEEEVVFENDQSTEVTFNLIPTDITVNLSIEPWGNVYLDGELIAERVTGGDAFRISARPHTLSVVHPTFGTWERRLDPSSEETFNYSVDFRNLTTLRVLAYDENQELIEGRVFINGQNTHAITPMDVDLPLGQHIIEVRAEGFESTQLTASIDPLNHAPEPLKFILRRKQDVR